MKNKSGIYMILNTYNNKCYIGSTKNFSKRKYEHFNTLSKNKHHSSHLQKAYNKYGREKFVFVVLEECEVDKLIEREIFWIKLKNSINSDYGYNMATPQSNEGLKYREESILKRRINAHKQFYKDNRITLEEFLAGKRARDLYIKTGNPNKEKIFVFNKTTGEKEYEFESISSTASFFKVSQKRISEVCNNKKSSYIGYIFVKEKDFDASKEYKKILKKDLPKVYITRQPFKGNPLKCINIETNEETLFNNKQEAIEQLGFTSNGINKVLYGNRRSHKGYEFELLK